MRRCWPVCGSLVVVIAKTSPIDTRGLCQLRSCTGQRAGIWIAWPQIGIVTLCLGCWEEIKRWEVQLFPQRTPEEWASWIRGSLRQRYD